MSAITQTFSSDITISDREQTGHNRSLSICFYTVYSLEGTVNAEPHQPQKIELPHRLRIPGRADAGTSSSEDIQASEWSQSPQSTLVSPTAPSLISPSPTDKDTNLIASTPAKTLDRGVLEVSEIPTKPLVAWLPVKDPIALLGLTQRPGLEGMNKCGRFIGLAPTILHHVFDLLDPCTSTCLGLTCRKLYNFSKYKYPGKISLWECSPSNKQEARSTLGDLLEQWMGPRYRRRIWTLDSIAKAHSFRLPQYLIRDIYGAAGGPAEIALAKRYLDYYSSRWVTEQGEVYILPYPFNKGEDWYSEAFKCIKNDAKYFHGRDLWHWNAWMSFWMPFDVFWRVSYMDKLRVLQWFEYKEWVESMEVAGYGLLRKPSGADKLCWRSKRYLRWVSWWVGGLSVREPFPGPEPGQRRRRRQNPPPDEPLRLSLYYI